MVFEEFERPAILRERIERAIETAIIAGKMTPDELYSAPVLGARFRVSATPVREAMMNLEKRGLVEVVRNRGYRVTQVNQREMQQIVYTRQLLEAGSMRDLALKFPSSAKGRFMQLADAIRDGARDHCLEEYLQADRRFHLELTDLLENQFLSNLVLDLRLRTRLPKIVDMMEESRLDETVREHYELVEQLAVGNSAEAFALMQRHVGHALGWWSGGVEEAGS